MPFPFPYAFPFFFGGPITTVDADGCWIGLPSAFERQLLATLKSYPIEQLRLRTLYTVTTTHDYIQSARALLQMAFDTEAGAVLVKMINLSPDVLKTKVCPRRRYLDVDADLHSFKFLIEPALTALGEKVPSPYIDFLRRFLSSDYPRYRVSAVAALLCLAAATS